MGGEGGSLELGAGRDLRLELSKASRMSASHPSLIER